ncbi:helix-turn-helix domain-containing protein [Saccharopolyspora sp. NPDC050389]|uniref:helix-turn-helix domain-containing protein n=1 Tax=Saccharopolyspora sp. NPDC050389 TaxID=3155516 RepID=UPI0033F9463C
MPNRISECSGPDPDAPAAFVTDFTAALIDTGLPRTAAGVMACLFTAENGSRTAAELAQHLQVSAATISHAVGLLEEQALIRRGRDDRGRRHRYFIDEDAAFRSAVVGVRANQRLADTALRGAGIFGADTAAGARLAATGQFLEQFGNDLIRSAEHWHATVGKGLKYAQADHASTE